MLDLEVDKRMKDEREKRLAVELAAEEKARDKERLLALEREHQKEQMDEKERLLKEKEAAAAEA